MGSNLSRYNGFNGRRAQSSDNFCNSKITNLSKIVFPFTRSSRDRYKFSDSLPNHLNQKNSLDENVSKNNMITDTISGNLGGTLPNNKRSSATYISDEPSNTLNFVNHRLKESLEANPWKYRQDDADLIKCWYGKSIHKNYGSNTSTSNDSGSCYYKLHRNPNILLRDRTHRSVKLDVKETLPKQNQDSKKRSTPSLGQLGDGPTHASRISIDKIDDKLLFKIVHKPDCEVMKYRHQHHQKHLQQHMHQHHEEKYVNFKMHQLTINGEIQDQGHASERSPEDEHLPLLSEQSFADVISEDIFQVTLKKSSRGLGLSVSGGGTTGPIRIKRLFPQQPAALSNKLQSGDILLSANGIPLTNLTNYEALEVLRTTSSIVELVVCRIPGEPIEKPTSIIPLPSIRKDSHELTLRIPQNQLRPDIELYGEFNIEMMKEGGSLGFTLRKAHSNPLGHYVRALVREPALSDGRIQPGDKIIAVDGALLSPMSHEEAVALLRQCGPRVTLRLYRELVQTPISAVSPTDSECLIRPTKTYLRQEAVDMLCNLTVQKFSPNILNDTVCSYQSSSTSCNLPKRLLRPAIQSFTTNEDDDEIIDTNELVGSKGLLKWKGIMFAPNNIDEIEEKYTVKNDKDTNKSRPLTNMYEQGHEVFMVELTRRWNSRLGFSLQTEGKSTVISAVYPDSVAAKDGRLKQGDILIMVNDESIEHMSTANTIDLLRKIRGSIEITVLRRKKNGT